MTAALSDNLPFYDDPDNCKPCEWCNKLMYRQGTKYSRKQFRERKACCRSCHKKLRAQVYSGQQWGSLKVLREGGVHIKPNGKKSNKWVCECLCGVKVSVRAEFLKNGDIRSCGCGGSIAPNQKFGMLKTIKKGKPYIRPNGTRHTTWICECTCGVVTTVHASHLLEGQTSSCGCKTTTRLENAVELSLNRLDVSYKKEYTPKSLANNGFQYRLDFYLPEHKVNIEADGKAWHRDGNKYKSAEEQRAYDRYRNWWIQQTLNCYILRLSEDFLDTIHWRFLDNRLRLFLRSTLELSPKDRPWKRVTYDFE